MTKHWWKVNRQSTIDEYDELSQRDIWNDRSPFLWAGISMSIYWIIYFVLREWDDIFIRTLVSVIFSVVISIILMVGWRMIDNERIREEALSK